MNYLHENWVREVKQSRIVTLTDDDDDAYIEGVDVKVWDVVHKVAGGLSEYQLMERYPTLTKADMRACSLFVYLRAVGQI